MSIKKNNIVGVVIIAVVVMLVIAFGIMFMWPTSADAQTSVSGSQSSSGSSAHVDTESSASAGVNSNQQIYLDQRGNERVKTTTDHSGSYTVRNAPAVQAPSMGSGHPCGLGGSIGISIIGGGAAGGVTHVDEACLLAQMGQGEAALIMIANRNQEACAALRQVGRIPANSLCSDAERRTRAAAERSEASSFTRPDRRPRMSIECVKQADGSIAAQYVKGYATAEQAVAYCSK